MIGPMLVGMGMHDAWRGKFLRAMGMGSLQVIRMIVTIPPVLRIKVGNQQALSMMPAITEDIIIFLAFGSSLILAQAIPFAMRMLLDSFSHQRRDHNTIARSFKEKAAMNVHEAIEAELFIYPTNFGEQFSPKCHQIA